jgi:chromosome segregation and condensation protein ScpB
MIQLYKPEDFKRVLETALLVANEPMPLAELKKLFDQEFDDDTWRTLLDDLRRDWANRGVELVQLATGWRFQTRPEYQGFLDRLKNREAAALFARRDGNLGHHRLPPTGESGRHRRHPRGGRFA